MVFSSHQLDMVEDLCQDVAIINRGRVVMGGEVRQLKMDSPYWVIEMEMRTGDTRAAPSRLESVVSVDFDGYRHRIVVRQGRGLDAISSPGSTWAATSATSHSPRPLCRNSSGRR